MLDKTERIKRFQIPKEGEIFDDTIYRTNKKDDEIQMLLNNVTFYCYEHHKRDIRKMLLTPLNEGN